ncbi:EamA family transporter [Conexibacter sp. SYSU D00693]|uniref:EamA family transporter n=1 Tax=Conexibacter sp. SYSU D00693 TaxID=2812560 RepID=UPI00196A5A01|nr:EamA family transporter [Conexibacter sp. SYSU D00693]
MAAVLALLASVLYGVSNFLGPTMSRHAPLFVVLLAGQAVAFLASGTLALATGADGLDGTQLAAALGAGVGNAVGLLGFYRAAQLGPLSLVTPLGALGAGVPVVAGLVSGEPATALKLAGVALALGGAGLAARRPTAPVPDAHAPAGGPTVRHRPEDRPRAVAWALGSAVAFGGFLSLMAPAADGSVLWAVCASRVSLLTIVAATGLVLGQALRAPAARLPLLAVPGLLLFSGTLAYSAATQHGDLSVVSVLGSLFPVVTVGLAFVLLRERLASVQAAGVAAAVAGTVLLSLP